jgi:tRNA threonylcarbamoyladenosine modification (KEOPS) complex  Pcc1 subunit
MIMKCRFEFEPGLDKKIIEPEIESTERIKVSIKGDKKKTTIDVETSDFVSLKAVLNSYLRLVEASKKTSEVLK